MARKQGFVRARAEGPGSATRLAAVLDHLERLSRVHARLADAQSRSLLIELLTFRILGPDHIRLPTGDARYWSERDSLDGRFLRRRAGSRSPGGMALDEYALPGVHEPIRVQAHRLDILNVFRLEQYAYRKSGQDISVREGDIVVDGGACWGDSALYFADRAGSTGQVHSFEFDRGNLEVLRRNLGLNPGLARRVSVVASALWDRAGECLRYSPAGAATSVTDASVAGPAVRTETIDGYVARTDLPRVDFIKLDIEGAELRALRGAEQTLRRWRPTLAIALYHHLRDFFEIPEYLLDLGLDYRLFLGHYTIHAEETILFAVASDRR
jgi:FkbM family methyltransferase